jgi:hypothetical protein
MTTPIEKFLEKYQNRMLFEYINFKPKEPVKVIWWGVQKITTIKDVNTGEPKEVVQLLVKVNGGKYKIISTTSFSLLKQLAEIQKELGVDLHYSAVRLKITQFKESSLDGKFKTYYKVEKIEFIETSLKDREAEETFLYGEIEEIEQ